MKSVKRSLAILLVAALFISLLAGCGSSKPAETNQPSSGSSDSGSSAPATSAPAAVTAPPKVTAPPTPEPEAEVKYADSLDVVCDNNPISNLDPAVPASLSPGTYYALIMTHDTLVTSLGDGEYAPNLATEWSTDDYITFNFKLRDDIVFDNGEKMTAEDVVYTCKHSQDGPGSPGAGQWSPVETITAKGDYEVEMVLKEMNVTFLFNLSNIMTCILNKKACEANAETGPWVGTGAFKVTEFLAGDHVTMVRSDSYAGDPAPTRQITLRYVPETSTRTIMMQNKEYQLSFGIGNDDAALFQNDPEFVVIPELANNPQGLQFNMDDPIVGDINLRKAFLYGIDREEICIVARGDWAMPPADGTIWGYETEFRNSSIPVIPHDEEKAKEYLAMSSYKGEPVEISVGNPTNVLVAETIQRQLEPLGINIVINSMDTPSLNAYNQWGNNKSQITAASFGFNMSASSANNLYLPGGSNNRSQYNNPEVADLLNQAKLEGDAAKRGELYKKVQELVAEDLPGAQMLWLVLTVVATKNLGGWVIPSDTYAVDLRGLYEIVE